ncbi:S24 family peptidase [Novosphingobium naphthalenivorans]|uniref:S24 family peptidase n=1 Tax=Novosphingobium naphthalenivorans TaxID=273168 RepID=UPI00082FECEB|nr:LexA family transcriptional regulator [Novosphingobium naphthalenivorans]
MDPFAQDTDLVRRLVEFAGLAPAQVAKRAGISASTINRPLNGTATTRLGRAALEKLMAAFPDFPGWPSGTEALADRRLAFKHQPPERDDTVEIDEIDLRYGLGAAFIDGPVSSEKRVFSRAWLRNFTRAAPEHLFWTIGDGDSMEPTIRSGEVILIDTSQKTPRMAEGIWAVAMGEFGMVKRLHFAGKDEGLKLVSDNQLIPPISVAEDELHIIGRVVAVMRRL